MTGIHYNYHHIIINIDIIISIILLNIFITIIINYYSSYVLNYVNVLLKTVHSVALYDKTVFLITRNHYICSTYAAKMMSASKSGLIVNVSSMGGTFYLFNVAYGIGKAGVSSHPVDELFPLYKSTLSQGVTRTPTSCSFYISARVFNQVAMSRVDPAAFSSLTISIEYQQFD